MRFKAVVSFHIYGRFVLPLDMQMLHTFFLFSCVYEYSAFSLHTLFVCHSIFQNLRKHFDYFLLQSKQLLPIFSSLIIDTILLRRFNIFSQYLTNIVINQIFISACYCSNQSEAPTTYNKFQRIYICIIYMLMCTWSMYVSVKIVQPSANQSRQNILYNKSILVCICKCHFGELSTCHLLVFTCMLAGIATYAEQFLQLTYLYVIYKCKQPIEHCFLKAMQSRCLQTFLPLLRLATKSPSIVLGAKAVNLYTIRILNSLVVET